MPAMVQATDTNTDARASLCSDCSQIPFARAVEPQPDWTDAEKVSGRVLGYAGTKYREADATQCSLCPVLRSVRVARQHWNSSADTLDDNIYVSPLSRFYGQIYGWGDGTVSGQPRGVSTISVCPTSGFLSWSYPHDLRMRHNTGAPEQAILLAVDPGRVTNEFDASLVLQWLQWCREKHPGCVNGTHARPAYGITLIDCQTRRLVEHVEGVDYVALSYVWGKTVSLEPNFSSRMLPTVIPAVAEDAMIVTRALGFRYLWVDRYCIDQQSPKHTQQQVEQMDVIYRGAELTIVAAAGQDGDYGLAGVNPSTFKPAKRAQIHVDGAVLFPISAAVPLREIGNKKWTSRGWTYQEAQLSRRCLVFSEEWIYFECTCMNCWMRQEFQTDMDSNALAEQLTLQSKWPQLLWKFPNGNSDGLQGYDAQSKTALEPLRAICSLISGFSKRQLTFDSDGLRAFLGVLQHFSTLYEFRVQHVWGVPFLVAKPEAVGHADFQPTLPGSSSFFPETLCWLHTNDGTDTRRKEIPSWSWAGRAGAKSFYEVRWPPTPAGGDWKRARVVSMADNNRGPGSLIQMEAVFILPDGSIKSRKEWGLCIWNDFTASVSLDGVEIDHADGSEFIRDFEAGKLRVCIMYGIRGQMFQGLVVRESPGSAGVYTRAGVLFFSHDQKKAANQEERAQWNREFERNLEESGWCYEAFWLE